MFALPLVGCSGSQSPQNSGLGIAPEDCPETLRDSDAELTARRFAGSYVVSGDELELAGFATLTLRLDNTYFETGRTDGQSVTGSYASPAELSLPEDFGEAPADLRGPFLRLVNNPDGDGEWVFGRVQKDDTVPPILSLTLYAARSGQGLRWVAPYTLNLIER